MYHCIYQNKKIATLHPPSDSSEKSDNRNIDDDDNKAR
jgi:hypothetical protein